MAKISNKEPHSVLSLPLQGASQNERALPPLAKELAGIPLLLYIGLPEND
jgi:hypothetical protein